MAEAAFSELRGKAVLSCFVKSNKGTLYAVICKHVRNAAKECFFVQDESGDDIPFATKLGSRKSSAAERYNNFDIEIIKIREENIKRCKSVFRNSKGEVQNDRVRMYDKAAKDLHNKTVFMSVQMNTKREFDIKLGEVLPFQNVHEVLRESYNSEVHFVVGNKSGDAFSEEGDSGRLVFLEKDGNLYLVGIVVHMDNDQTVCLLLRQGLEYLNRTYKLELTLYEESDYTCPDGDEFVVEPGATLTFFVNVIRKRKT